MRYAILFQIFDEKNPSFTTKVLNMEYQATKDGAITAYNKFKNACPDLIVPESYSAEVIINVLDDANNVINYHFRRVRYDFSEKKFFEEAAKEYFKF